ncbi:MAG: hypothetical protein K8R23_11915 [Chthoniobacter sp.]|nr:hypothetical protein [Chthoniobacter sp.]
MKAACFAALMLTAAVLRAGEVTIALPPETAALKPGPGADLAKANCMTCHSVDYISSQPKMPRKFWEAEVKKRSTASRSRKRRSFPQIWPTSQAVWRAAGS